jgi:hypothetical protein
MVLAVEGYKMHPMLDRIDEFGRVPAMSRRAREQAT